MNVMEFPVNQLLTTRLFGWMTAAELEFLANCFDAEAELLSAGESRSRPGWIGYLLSGEAALHDGRERRSAGAGCLFGLREEDGGGGDIAVTAVTDCLTVWMNEDIMTSVCYRACWFHGRFVTEARRSLRESGPQREGVYT